ncbi:MAG: hypothetical protein ACRD3T_09805 [Terriglobia bacterium]
MIKDTVFWESWEAHAVLSQPADFQQNLRLLDAMYEHARRLGIFPGADPLAGLEAKLRLAEALNVPTTPETTGPGA